MKRYSKLTLIIMLLLAGFLLMPALSFADEDEEEDESGGRQPGEMLINTETIQDGQVTQHDQFRPIGYEIAPFLFLEDMMEVEEQRVKRNEEFITTTRNRLFLEDIPNIRFDTSEFVDRLFVDEEVVEVRGGSVGIQERYFHVPVWVIVIGIVAATGFLVYVAVILGQKLGHIIHKQKEGEEVSG